MVMLKFVIACLFTAVFAMLIKAMDAIRPKPPDWGAVRMHRWWAWLSFSTTVVALVMVRFMVVKNGGLKHKHLFELHLPFAIAYLIALGYLLICSMQKSPKIDRLRASSMVCLSLYCVTYITGMTLLCLI